VRDSEREREELEGIGRERGGVRGREGERK
jgi:hypothetical protein